jgi:hypothetical protein
VEVLTTISAVLARSVIATLRADQYAARQRRDSGSQNRRLNWLNRAPKEAVETHAPT